MPQDVTTRWNSTYDMLDFAVHHRSTINDITGDKTENLCKYELDDDEWVIVLQLRNTLKVCGIYFRKWIPIPFVLDSFPQIFKDATLFFSRSMPCLAAVIPAMDHIDETLTSNSLDFEFKPSIRTALGISKKTLNKYYNATDQSEVYRIAMGT
jgi:hypothetical protein